MSKKKKYLKTKKDIIESWQEISERKDKGEELDAIDLFIYENEPAGDAAFEFRKTFIDALYCWSGNRRTT